MNLYQFMTSMIWASIVFLVIGVALYLILSGRLKWVEYQTILGKIGLNISTNLGIKDLTPDEILAFESFVYRDLAAIERGARLAYIILFIEKGLLGAQFVDNVLKIELTDKGKLLHTTLIAECEKKLLISPKTEIQWAAGEKKIVAKAENLKKQDLEEALKKLQKEAKT